MRSTLLIVLLTLLASAVLADATTATETPEIHTCAADSGAAGAAVDPDVYRPFDVPPQPLADSSAKPDFPAAAQEAGVGGKVTMRVLVSARGEVVKWYVLKAEPAGLGFEEEVAKVICDWRFEPARYQGQPVSVWVALPFSFKVTTTPPLKLFAMRTCRPDTGSAGAYPEFGSYTPFESPPEPLPDASPAPEFPPLAKDYEITGKVMVQVLIDSLGKVAKWRFVTVKPKGVGFEEEVEKVICRWRFKPATQEGRAVSVWAALPFNFKIPGVDPMPEQTEIYSCTADSAATEAYPELGDYIVCQSAPQIVADSFARPHFPIAARQAELDGRVLVLVLVDTQGKVAKWTIAQVAPKGIGIEEEVAAVVCRWRFEPARDQGRPVSAWVAVPINFNYRQD